MKIIAVVAPTFNEEENITKFIDRTLAENKKIPNYQIHIVVSDSHSRDRTREIVRKIARLKRKVHLIDSQPGPGRLGTGLTTGLNFAANHLKADLIVTMEADLTENPDQIINFIKKLETCDVVIGSRYAPGGKIENWTWWRRALSLGANFFLGMMAFNFQIHEYTNLYRAFKANVWHQIRPKVSVHRGWLFVPAFVFRVLETDFKVIEEPIIYADRLGGRSKMRTLSYTQNLVRFALAYRLRKILGR